MIKARHKKRPSWAKDGLTQKFCDLGCNFSFASKCIIAKKIHFGGVIYDTSQ